VYASFLDLRASRIRRFWLSRGGWRVADFLSIRGLASASRQCFFRSSLPGAARRSNLRLSTRD
jgi:hypothetical protein